MPGLAPNLVSFAHINGLAIERCAESGRPAGFHLREISPEPGRRLATITVPENAVRGAVFIRWEVESERVPWARPLALALADLLEEHGVGADLEAAAPKSIAPRRPPASRSFRGSAKK